MCDHSKAGSGTVVENENNGEQCIKKEEDSVCLLLPACEHINWKLMHIGLRESQRDRKQYFGMEVN